MGKVFTALAVSVDGFITGRDPVHGHGPGDGGLLFDWYFNGDSNSRVFDGFRLSEPSRDEVILHQVPVLLGAGRRFFGDLPAHIGLTPAEAVPAPGVTHLRYRIEG